MGIIKYFVFHYSILMFLFLYSFYQALFFKNVICFKTLLSNIHCEDSVPLVLWCQFTLSPPHSGSVWPLIKAVLPSDSSKPPPAKSSGFTSGFPLLVLTVGFIANNHSLLLEMHSLCSHCCFDSLPSAGIVLSHLSILLPLSPNSGFLLLWSFLPSFLILLFIRQSLWKTITYTLSLTKIQEGVAQVCLYSSPSGSFVYLL